MGPIKYYLFTRLVGIILLQIAAILGTGWYYLNHQYLQQKIDKSFNELKAISQNIHYFYKHQFDEITSITKHNYFSSLNKQKAKERLEEYLKTRQLITSIHYYNAKGFLEFVAWGDTVDHYVPEKHYSKHFDKNFVTYFEKALKTKKPFLSEALYTKSNIFYHVGFVPVFKGKNKEVQGILSFAFFPRLNPFEKSFSGLSLYQNNFLVLTDNNANIISSNNIDIDVIKTPMKNFIEKRGFTKETPFNYKTKEIDDLKYNINGKNYFFISFKIKELPFIAVLGLDNQIVQADIYRLIKFLFALIAISSLIAIIFSAILSKKLSFGIEYLGKAISNIKKGIPIKKDNKKNLHRNFQEALDELDDLSSEIQKGKLLGKIWGQKSIIKDE